MAQCTRLGRLLAAAALLALLINLSLVPQAESRSLLQDHSGHDHGSGEMADDSCIADPTNATCATYEWPHDYTHAALDPLCQQQMPDMPGCSVYAACETGTVSPDSEACGHFTLLATVCTDMPDMGLCANYTSACRNGSLIPKCTEDPPIAGLPSYTATKSDVASFCAANNLGACANCTESSCADPLATLSDLCLADSNSTSCTAWTEWCEKVNVNSTFTAYCGNVTAEEGGHDHGGHDHGSGEMADDSCIADPTNATCATYEWPHDYTHAALDPLCQQQMPDMPGCSIYAACETGTVSPDSEACGHFTLLATVCTDMPDMGLCANYTSACRNGSLISKCTEDPPIAGLPSYTATKSDVASFCAANNLGACANCTESSCADPLATLSNLCLADSNSTSCTGWTEWCEKININSTFTAYCGNVTAGDGGHDHGGHDHGSGEMADDSCIADPTNATCATYEWPHDYTHAALDPLCQQQMPDMPGCSVYAACETGTVSPDSEACGHFTLLATVCTDMPDMSLCANYTSACRSGSLIPKCTEDPPIAGLLSYTATKGAVASFCAANNLGACANCTESACADPLATLGALCQADSASSSCTAFNAWCASINVNGTFTSYCGATGAVTAPPPPAASAQAVVSDVLDACVSDPTPASCATYTYPEASANADITTLCGSMPNMPGCSVDTMCKAGIIQDSTTCAPFTILATLCTDMPSMGGCQAYKSLCGTGTTVQQCSTYPAIASLPSWTATTGAVSSICAEMPTMSQCSSCTRTSCPDPLSTLAGLCQAMPSMSQCSAYKTMCAANSDALTHYCGTAASSSSVSDDGLDMPMPMYFMNGVRTVIIWKEWVTRSRAQYAGSIIAVLFFGVASMAVKTCSTVLGLQWKANARGAAAATGGSWLLPSPTQAGHNAIKAFLVALSTCLDFFNMLIAMTLNVGLFLAVVLGYALGALLMSHVPEAYAAHLHHARAEADDAAHRAATRKLESGDAASNTDSMDSPRALDAPDHQMCCPGPM